MTEQFASIDSFFAEADSVEVISEGAVSAFDAQSEQFAAVTGALEKINADGYEMPALGVSVDSLTKNEMKKGVWLRFVFGGRREHNGMPFDALLIKIEPNFRGYNIERQNGGIYGGRCFYFNLNSGDMSALSDTVNGLLK